MGASESIKVLHVCENANGGIATYLNTLTTICGDSIDELRVVPASFAELILDDGRTIAYPRKRRGFKTLMNLVVAARYAARERQSDFIFFHSSFTTLVMLVFRILRIPGVYVYCPHAWGRLAFSERPIMGRVVSFVEGRLAGLADVVLNISNNDCELARQLGYKGVHVVVENALPDLLDSPTASPFDADEQRIDLLFVGRFVRQKGLDILLTAFDEAARHNPALHLHIVGGGVDGSGLPISSGERITVHPWVHRSQIPAYYNAADLVVLSSRWEGLPMVLIEGLRAGTPVMVADTSGLGGLVDHGSSGFVVQPTPPAFAAALSELTLPDLAAMRPAAREQYKRRFAGERFRNEMIAFFRRYGAGKPGEASRSL